MQQRKKRLAVIGVGRIGTVHLGNLVKYTSEAEVVAISDCNRRQLDKVSEQFRVSAKSEDYHDLLEDPGIDAVVICSSTDTHAQIIMEAAAARKSVFCEKPIDFQLERIVQALDEVKKYGIRLMVGFNRRFDPSFSRVQRMVEEGKIGRPEILKITSRDPAPPSIDYIRSSGGLFVDMAIHDFDMARFLMGSEVAEVYARGTVLVDPVFEDAGDFDTAISLLSFENGVLATIDNSRQAVYGYDQRVEVFGSEGLVAADNRTTDSHVYLNAEGRHSASPEYFFMERYVQSYRMEMSAFVEALMRDEEPPVTGKDGLMAVVVAQAAALSAQENRPVKIQEIFDSPPAVSLK